jgi:predicted membrane-bound spermidine synthase
MAEDRVPRAITNKVMTLVLACFFFSGLTGLIYEILWTRMIVKIIGGTPFAVSIILTVFMGGPGPGQLPGRPIHRHHQYGPAKRYIKAAKSYFTDNGIIHSLNAGVGAGQLFENFVLAEFEKRRKLGMISADQFY